MINEQITPEPTRKKQTKNKNYWCAPRKVKSTAEVIKFDNMITLDGKPKKKRRKKLRKNVKKRIDILAQPKSTKTQSEHKSSNHIKMVRFPTRHKVTVSPNNISPRKTLKPKKLKSTKNVSRNLMIKSKKKKSLPIVLPKKIVQKKLKELTDSKNI
ncbi:uncharacterized protein LOC143265870 isoform X2 [Megachile rotundata]|uniref:uncharacterized protein LOC143265870 isoform X2 n=1 Tax=Megachile rotundata TaxID=143995 RepID=UPI003FD07C8A